MELRLSKLIPGAALIYERDGKTVYARYRDPPYNKIPRWSIGEETLSLTYDDWRRISKLAEQHPILRKQLDKTLNLFYILKDGDDK